MGEVALRTDKFTEAETQAEGGNGRIVLQRSGDERWGKILGYDVIKTGLAGGRVTATV